MFRAIVVTIAAPVLMARAILCGCYLGAHCAWEDAKELWRKLGDL